MALLRSRAAAVILAAIFSAIAGPMLTFFAGASPRASIAPETFLMSLVAIYIGWPFGALAGAAFGYALSAESRLRHRGSAFWISVAVFGALAGALVGPYIWAIDRATSTTKFFNYGTLSWMGAFGGTCCALAAAVIVRILLWKSSASSSPAP